jgi:23S rRNA (adenine2030-N6)-methyltransferase
VNYRHAFHAGNHADVIKHAVLALILRRLTEKPTPFAVLDTHAGAGAYDLESEAARRSPEWRDGVGRLWDWAQAPAALAPYLHAVRAANPGGTLRAYPGSPALIAAALRPGDRCAACEKHPEEAVKLRTWARSRPGLQVHERDGWEAVSALTPFPERRGLVLIDPPYEQPDELARGVDALRRGLARFGHGMFLWWRPLKDAASLDAADREIAAPALRVDLGVAAPMREGPLTASSLLVINPPFGLEHALREALPALAPRLATGPGAFWRLDAGARPAQS